MLSTKRFKALKRNMLLVTLLLLIQADPAFAYDNHKPEIYPPDSHPFAKTYAEWSNAWWQWAFSISLPDNPLFDTTGDKCGLRQSGKVFFLAGTAASGTVTRNCSVP